MTSIAPVMRTYAERDYWTVVRHMKDRHYGRKSPTTEPELARVLGMNERTVRQILADADGVDFVLAGGDNSGGTYVAEFLEEAERKTRALQSRAKRLTRRAERRRQWATRLPRQQGGLWGGDVEYDGEEEADE